MKKIILLAASVLALGLLASCKQEITGDLKVEETMNMNGDSWTKTYYYTAAGSASQTITETNTSKASASVAESNTGKSATTSVNTITLKNGKDGVTLTVSENRRTNTITYTYSFPVLSKTTVSTTTVGGVTGSSVSSNAAAPVDYGNNTYTYNNNGTNTTVINGHNIYIYKTDGKYFFVGQDGSYILIRDFNPTADTIDFSKFLVDNTSTTQIVYTNAGYADAAGTNGATITSWNNKQVTTTNGVVYNFTLTKK